MRLVGPSAKLNLKGMDTNYGKFAKNITELLPPPPKEQGDCTMIKVYELLPEHFLDHPRQIIPTNDSAWSVYISEKS